jgi:hypothetical protein
MTEDLIGQLQLWVISQGYDIVNVTKQGISFKFNLFQNGSRGAGLKKMSKGQFEISILNNSESKLKFIYYINFLPDVLLLLFAVIPGLLIGGRALLWLGFTIPIFIQFWIRIDSAQLASNELMKKFQ